MKKLYMKKLGLLVLLSLFTVGTMVGQKTWYVLNNATEGTGDNALVGWSNPDNWTEDPAAQIFSNPGFDIPASGDNVVIKAGKEITLPEGLVVNAGAVTVDGALHIEGSTDAHEMSALLGSGRVYIKGAKLPAGDVSNFISPGSGAGTVVLQGAGPINLSDGLKVYNLEIDMDGSEGAVLLQNNLTVNGNLNVKSGKLMFDGASSLTLLVNRNVSVQADGHIGVTTVSAFHNMIVKGDFRNYGTVKFSNVAQYEPATNGAVRLTFEGASNNDFVINGSTQLYRLFINKGENDFYTLSVTSNNIDHFKLMGPYEGDIGIESGETIAWQTLPLVVLKGTLKLGANLVIDKLGYLRNGTEPKEFFIPEGAGLWINGAELNTGIGDSPMTWEAAGTGISVQGKLRISAGSLTTPASSSGITYKGTIAQPSELIIEGGEIFVTQLRAYVSSSNLNYKQSGGTIDFYTRTGRPETSPVFNLPNSTQVFEMSGGTMIFRVANNRGEDSNGIYIRSGEGNFNVSGGEIKIFTSNNDEEKGFSIYSTASFYDVVVQEGASSEPVFFSSINGLQQRFNVLNDLTIGASTTVDAGNNELFIGGDLMLRGNFIFESGTINLSGENGAVLTNSTGDEFNITNLNIIKSSADAVVSLAGTGSFSFGNVSLSRGNLDLVDKSANVTGNISLYNGNILNSHEGLFNLSGAGSSELFSSKGKQFTFGSLNLNKNVELKSHVLATEMSFGGNHIVNLGIYNLELEVADFTTGTWSNNRMFRTAGNASNGGLTLPVELSGNYGTGQTGQLVQLFPVGTTEGYTPAEVFARNSYTTSGRITVKSVDGPHPTMTNDTYVLKHYWRMNPSELDGVVANNDIRYRFTHHSVINVDSWSAPGGATPPEGIEFVDNDWKEHGQGVKVGDYLLNFPFGVQCNQDYTFGVVEGGRGHSVLSPPRTLYSRNDYFQKNHNPVRQFSSNRSWSETGHAGGATNSAPTSADYLIIHEDHTVFINAIDARASQVEINGVLQVDHNTSGHQIGVIKGSGRLRFVNNQGYFPNNFIISGDYTEFSNTETAVIEFAGSGNYHLPANTVIPYYPNLHISGGGTKNTPYNGSVYINGELFVDNASLSITGIPAGVLSIGNDLRISTGTLTLSSTSNHHTNVGGDILIQGATGRLRGGNSNNLYLTGNIYQNAGNIEFNNSNKTNVYFVGDNPAEFVSQVAKAKSSFYTITVNKSSENTKAHFKNGFVFSTPGDARPLKLLKGIAHIDNNTIDVILNSGTTDFQIPSTSTLIVDNGSKVRAGGSNSSLFLDGALVVDNGGEFLWQGAEGNHVKYSASGNASIWLGDEAKFSVGSQLYRNSEGGILKFTQAKASSEVKIATVNAPLTQKGVFEVLNGGSSFVQAEENSEIQILRGQSGTNPVPSVVFNPDAITIAKGSKFVMGDASDANKISLLAEKAMGGIDVVGASNVELLISPLTLNGSLNAGAGSTFTANDLDVSLKGDFKVDRVDGVSGIYTSGINTTYFSGSSDQHVTGTVDFYNLSKLAGTNSLIIDGTADVQVANNLVIDNGSIVTGDNNLVVKGNASVAFGATVGGIELSGAELQLLSGGGDIGRLLIDNAGSVMVPSQPDAISVTNVLVLKEGVFNIGSNLLQLGKEAVVTDGVGGDLFSENNMIQTFLSFTDAGIRKYFPVVDSPTSFIYPIGSQNKYTPVTFDISSLTSPNGYIRVKAANERHVSIIDDLETTMVEPENVLKYYWTVDAKNVYGFKAKVSMKAYSDDVTPPLEGANYIVARIKANEDLWDRLDVFYKDEVDEITGELVEEAEEKKIYFDNVQNVLTFNGYFIDGTDDLGISGDYTAGLKEAIPERVPTFASVAEGEWTNENIWAVYNPVTGVVGAPGVGVQQNGPLGSIVFIRENVNVSNSGRIAYRTEIEEGATLNIGSSINNRLGNVSGKGRLRLESGSLPAGFYEDFAKADGGVFEYSGSGDYYVLGGINTLNSVEFTGTGSRKLPDGTLRINGNLLIDGPVVNMVGTTALQIGKDLDFNSGSLELGRESKFVFNGNAPQSIGGKQPFTEENSLQQIVVDNTSGVNVNNDLIINSQLQLVRGPLTPGSGTIHLGASATAVGASANSFVNGVMSKAISGNEYFSFPVGKDNRFGAIGITDGTSGGVWTVEYFNAMPPYRKQTDNIDFVSNSEYWKVTAPSQDAEAAATLRWDDESGINPDGFDAVSIQPGEDSIQPGEDGIQPGEDGALWRVVNKTFIDENNQVVGLTKLAHSTSTRERLYSFGLATMPDVGYFTWKGRKSADWFNPANWYGNQVPSAGTPAIITLSDDVKPDHWPIIYGKGNPVAQANDLTIDAGITLTLDPGARLTVNGDLSIVEENGLVIKHETGEGKMASLLTKEGVTGEANVQLTLPTEQWFYLGSSIKNSTFGVFDPSQDDQAIVNVYRDRWYGIRAKHVDTPMLQLEGVTGMYLNYDGNINKTLSYSGELNNGKIARTYSEDRYQLFANPYPSFLNWENAEGWERANFEGTMWFRTKVGDAMTFVTYNREAIDGAKVALYPSEDYRNEEELALIAPMQAVFVRPLGASRNLVVSNAARTHGLSNSFLKSTSRSRKGDVVRIELDNGLSRDGAVVYFADGSEEGLDQGDSEKYKNDDAKVPEIFTRVDGQEVAINGLPVLTEAVRSIPLSVRHQQTGETKLSFDLSYYDGMHNVYFEDKETGAFLNVVRSDSYSYRVNETGVQDDRFVLHFYRVTTDLDTPMVGEEDAGNDISIKSIGDKVLVSVGMDMLQDGFGTVEIYTIEGRKVQEVPARSSRTLVILPGQSGVYIVRAVFGTKVKSERVLVNGK